MTHANLMIWSVQQRKYITNFSSFISANEIISLLTSNIEGIKPQLMFIGPLHTKKILETDTEYIAINRIGNIVIILTDTTSSTGNVLARAFCIASVVQEMNHSELNQLYFMHHQSSLDLAYHSAFNQPIPSNLNKHQEIIMLREQHNTDDYRQLSYLRKTSSVDINSVILKQFSDNNSSYIIQEWLFADDVIEKINKPDVTRENIEQTKHTEDNKATVAKKSEMPQIQTDAIDLNTTKSSEKQQCKTRVQSWTDAYLIGIEEIDKQHKFLFDTFDDLLDAVEQNETNEKIHIIIERLVMYGKFHFETEERLMDLHYNATHYIEHKKEHAYFIETVKQFQREYRYGNKTLINDIILFLKKWFVAHVNGSDKDLVDIKEVTQINTLQKAFA